MLDVPTRGEGRGGGETAGKDVPARRSSSGMGSTELLSSSMEPRLPINGFRLLVLVVLLPLPPRRSVGWLTPTPSSISSTPPLFSMFMFTGMDDSELALDLTPCTDPVLSFLKSPITEAVFGCSIPPATRDTLKSVTHFNRQLHQITR